MLPTDALAALALFALVASITPGPNNMMLLASGANYGLVRSIPHMLGVNLGFVLMIVLVGIGVGQIVTADHRIYAALQGASLLYLLWLAWKIANAGPVKGGDQVAGDRPMTFLGAALFQWVNPKAWTMVLTATSTFTRPDDFAASLAVVALVFGLINFPSIGIWTGFGVALRPLLQDRLRARIFNATMAVLLVLSVLPAARELLTVL
jgi:threonine/homoserine/homoserine lactone efflux protein